jgi:protein-tyrosine phosphatase
VKLSTLLYLVSAATAAAGVVAEVRERRAREAEIWQEATRQTLDGKESSSSQSSAQDLPS